MISLILEFFSDNCRPIFCLPAVNIFLAVVAKSLDSHEAKKVQDNSQLLHAIAAMVKTAVHDLDDVVEFAILEKHVEHGKLELLQRPSVVDFVLFGLDLRNMAPAFALVVIYFEHNVSDYLVVVET